MYFLTFGFTHPGVVVQFVSTHTAAAPLQAVLALRTVVVTTAVIHRAVRGRLSWTTANKRRSRGTDQSRKGLSLLEPPSRQMLQYSSYSWFLIRSFTVDRVKLYLCSLSWRHIWASTSSWINVTTYQQSLFQITFQWSQVYFHANCVVFLYCMFLLFHFNRDSSTCH